MLRCGKWEEVCVRHKCRGLKRAVFWRALHLIADDKKVRNCHAGLNRGFPVRGFPARGHGLQARQCVRLLWACVREAGGCQGAILAT